MPGMEKLAKKVSLMPCYKYTERALFSKAGGLTNQRRSNISDKNINVVLLLDKNLKWPIRSTRARPGPNGPKPDRPDSPRAMKFYDRHGLSS
ncbi:hypothetical protein RRG08_065073 [Elysia crispata]|uniref:Uncharacterized protein n=1 Tax=Elysia crispata TaxID=231223 RepID=A0AAE1E6D3_9GAST|nr:hypothetical protein RRG08_065073 [Elysia crispata]